MTESTRIAKNRHFQHILLLLILVFFITSAWIRIQQPLGQDELHWFIAAKTLYEQGIPQQYGSPEHIAAYSPHLYLYLVYSMFWLFGQTVQIARLPGILCGAISIMMIYLICSLSLRSNRCEQFRWPLMITFLYATTPAVIQGSAIIDIDMTILIPSILLMFLFFLKYEQTGDYRWAVLTGLAVSIAFWARVTTPPVIALLLMLYTLSTKKNRSHKLIIVGSILAGCLMFTGSWYIYCTITDIPFSAPFTYTSQSFFTKMMRADFSLLSNIIQNLTSFILWFGILPFLLLILVTWHRCTAFLKDYSLHEEDIFLIGGFILIGGYTLIGGSTFGYPKYQIPAISLIMIYFGINASRNENIRFHPHLKTIFIAVVSSAVMQVFLTGDILYDFRYSFREAEAFMLPVSKEIMMDIIVRSFVFIILSAVLIIFLVKFSSSKSLIGLLLLFSIGSNIGTSFIQNTATYYTGYNYGGKGTVETADYIRALTPPEGIVIAPSEIIYYLNLPNSRHIPNTLWTDVKELVKRLNNPNSTALVYSIPTNTIEQVKTITFNSTLQETLNRNYKRITTGSYIIWMRNKMT